MSRILKSYIDYAFQKIVSVCLKSKVTTSDYPLKYCIYLTLAFKVKCSKTFCLLERLKNVEYVVYPRKFWSKKRTKVEWEKEMVLKMALVKVNVFFTAEPISRQYFSVCSLGPKLFSPTLLFLANFHRDYYPI